MLPTSERLSPNTTRLLKGPAATARAQHSPNDNAKAHARNRLCVVEAMRKHIMFGHRRMDAAESNTSENATGKSAGSCL